MGYVSLYRKYRSQTFDDLIGQDHVVRTLQNGISSGRIAHSYLFTGPRGTGKTSTARLLAKCLCCTDGPRPDPAPDDPICIEIAAGSFIDVIELDAASESGVDDIREQIVDVADYRPMIGRYKVFIIDEVHDLSAKAFDALLKTIEEPPEHLVFILATTEYNKVPATIRSRCQKYEFHRASMADLIGRLNYVATAEGYEAEPAAIAAMARMADGGYRDALTLLEQAILTCEDRRITLSQVYDQLGLVSEEVIDGLLVAVRTADVTAIMNLLEEVARLGRDPRAILESMLLRLADLTRAAYQLEVAGGDSTREASLHEAAAKIGRESILHFRSELAEMHKVIREISLPRLWLESELIRVSMPRTAAPAAATPAPTREVAPIAAPAPVAVREAVPAPVVQEAAPVADEPWPKVMESLTIRSKTLALKLADVNVSVREGDLLVLEFDRAMDHDWLSDRPKAISMVAEEVRRVFGDGHQVKLEVRKRDSAADEPNAVELPLEGQRLEQLMKETFGAAEPLPEQKN